jgi:hypothetical protein
MWEAWSGLELVAAIAVKRLTTRAG